MTHLKINGETKPIHTPILFTVLLENLNMHLLQKRYALELNGEIIPRAKHSTLLLNDGDCLEIVTAIGGG